MGVSHKVRLFCVVLTLTHHCQYFLWACITSCFLHSHFLSESWVANDKAETVYFVSLLTEQGGNPLLASHLEMYHPDPMLSESTAATNDELLMYLNDPNLHLDPGFLEDEPELPDLSFQGLNCLAAQPCESIFQTLWCIFNHL